MTDQPTRRSLLKSAAGAGAAAVLAGGSMAMGDEAKSEAKPLDPAATKAGKLKQSVCQWCYKWDKEEFCANAQKLGLYGIDLVGADWFPLLKKYGLIGTMTPSHTIPKGLNKKENWDECLGKIKASLDVTAEAGFPNVICFSGNRDGMDEFDGMSHCAEAIKKVIGDFEKKNVTLNMELLNSKHSHKDYMCDRSDWGCALVKAVGSERFKLLYDIFHMQIMEGDVIQTIKDHHDCFGHYHTGGVPGRHEIDESQELYYPAIAKAIAETGYQGVFAHEFIPAHDPFAGLSQGVKTCTV